MEVNGAPELLCFPHSSEYLPLCSAEQTHSYRFGITWGWVNDDRIFIFGWTIPLTSLTSNDFLSQLHQKVWWFSHEILSDLQINALQFTGGTSLSCLLALGDRAITYRFNPLYYPGPQTLISEYAARGPRDEVLEPGITFPGARSRRFNIRLRLPALRSMWSLQQSAEPLSPQSSPPRRRRY